MESIFGVSLVVFVIAAIVLYFFIKSIIHWAITIGCLMILTILCAGIYIGYDAQAFASTFSEQNNLFALEDNGKLLASFVLLPNQTEPMRPATLEEIAYYDTFNPQTNATPPNNIYKLLVIQKSALDEVANITPYKDITLSNQEAFAILQSPSPKNTMVEQIYNKLSAKKQEMVVIDAAKTKENIAKGIGNESQIKALVFAALIEQASKENNVRFILDGVRKGTVEVLPQTVSFKFIKYLPDSWMERLSGLSSKKGG